MLSLWSDENFKSPERSKCYPLEPMYNDSIDVESLTSYIQRISEAHSIHVSSLVKHLIFPTVYAEEAHGYGNNELYKVYYNSYSINGFNQQALFFLYALKELTGRKDLEDLTWMKIGSLLSQGDIKVSRHWCPVCIDEQKNEMVIYEKLIWSLKSVTICIKHNCYLESICPICKKENKQLDLHSIGGHCTKCKSWLGSNDLINKNISKANNDWQNWVYENIEELLEGEMDEFVNRDFILKKVSDFLIIHFNRYNNTLINLSESMNYSRCTVGQWKRKAQKISFESFLILSYCTNVPIETILFKNNEINIPHIRKIEKDLVIKKDYIILSFEEKRKLLYKFIESEEYPPPKLNQVTNLIGYKSNESLKVHFPDECNFISKRYKEYKSKERNEKTKMIKLAISECVSTAVEEGKALNNSYIQSKVKIGRHYANPEIRNYIEEILIKNCKK